MRHRGWEPGAIVFGAVFFCTVAMGGASEAPWKEAGLDSRQAAAHLLNRFTFGPRPGDIERVVEMGIDAWLDEQLRGDLPEPRLEAKLAPLKALRLPSREISETYPNPGRLLVMAQRQGLLSPEDAPTAGGSLREQQRTRRTLMKASRELGYRPQRELLGQLFAQKVLRAVHSPNQLEEVLTDFWFNHFNVAMSDNQARGYLVSYERDALRPHVLGDFRTLLGATARHPAMLLYLDNAQSGADRDRATTIDGIRRRRGGFGPPRRGPGRLNARRRGGESGARPRGRQQGRQPVGLNENYARELLELHTLGVDGGYGQEDVVEVARAFTGWAVLPPNLDPRAQDRIRWLRSIQDRGGMGFVIDGEFLFRADVHDAEKKSVLGKTLPAGRGIEDGEDVLDLLAGHPSTARHLARKLAVRFVCDEPPAELVKRLASSFERTGGDLSAVIRTLVRSPEFWSPESRRQKIKSPFEVAVSAVRALDADVESPAALVEWISRMGQPLYNYQAPTGYPDRAEAWVNTGSLLNRMNFGLELATGRIAGVQLDLLALNGNREPESMDDALSTYAHLLLPQRDLTATLDRLTPLVGDPELVRKVAQAAPEPSPTADPMESSETGFFEMAEMMEEVRPGRRFARVRQQRDLPPPTALGGVVGVILGSPEFQRR